MPVPGSGRGPGGRCAPGIIRVGFTPRHSVGGDEEFPACTESVDARTIRIRPREAERAEPDHRRRRVVREHAEHDQDHDDRRDRHHDVDGTAHDRVETPADVADKDAHRDPDREKRGERLGGPDERRPSPKISWLRKSAPERVGPQQMLAGRTAERLRGSCFAGSKGANVEGKSPMTTIRSGSPPPAPPSGMPCDSQFYKCRRRGRTRSDHGRAVTRRAPEDRTSCTRDRSAGWRRSRSG